MSDEIPVQKILVLSANPKETQQLRLGEEIREIKEGLQLAKKRDSFQLMISSNYPITTNNYPITPNN